jgi:hypothetical protein
MVLVDQVWLVWCLMWALGFCFVLFFDFEQNCQIVRLGHRRAGICSSHGGWPWQRERETEREREREGDNQIL